MYRKRSKRSRLRGRRSCGYGQKFKHRGKGSKGGKGMAGTGKKAGQKITWVMRYQPDYLGKLGFTSRKKRLKVINVGMINDQIEKFLKKGKAKEKEGGFELEFKGFKILSSGKVDKKLFIKASAFSKKVKDKVTKAGGSITTS